MLQVYCLGRKLILLRGIIEKHEQRNGEMKGKPLVTVLKKRCPDPTHGYYFVLLPCPTFSLTDIFTLVSLVVYPEVKQRPLGLGTAL